jgi:hypothetical protein
MLKMQLWYASNYHWLQIMQLPPLLADERQGKLATGATRSQILPVKKDPFPMFPTSI